VLQVITAAVCFVWGVVALADLIKRRECAWNVQSVILAHTFIFSIVRLVRSLAILFSGPIDLSDTSLRQVYAAAYIAPWCAVGALYFCLTYYWSKSVSLKVKNEERDRRHLWATVALLVILWGGFLGIFIAQSRNPSVDISVIPMVLGGALLVIMNLAYWLSGRKLQLMIESLPGYKSNEGLVRICQLTRAASVLISVFLVFAVLSFAMGSLGNSLAWYITKQTLFFLLHFAMAAVPLATLHARQNINRAPTSSGSRSPTSSGSRRAVDSVPPPSPQITRLSPVPLL
jgi:hypothetical protein